MNLIPVKDIERAAEVSRGKAEFYKRLTKYLLIEKLGRIGLAVILILFAGITIFAFYKYKELAAIGFLSIVIGLPIIFLSIFNLRFGIIIIVIISFFILGILRFTEMPLGLLMDTLIGCGFFGVILKQIRLKDWSIANNPVTWVVLIWLAYCIFQVVNPWAASKLAWVYTIRGMALLMLLYFVGLFAFDSLNFVKLFIKLWIFLAVLAAVYALYQEFIGFHPVEMAWIMKDPMRVKMFYNWGRFRKFSYFSDPTIFGILMSHSALLCIVLATGSRNFIKTFILLVSAFLMMWAMIYSGTRTAIAMIPAGLFFFVILTFKRTIILLGIIFFVFGAFLVLGPFESFGPISRNNLARIRSTFDFEDDPSFAARLKNQAYIQPFIRTHPIGNGLGSIGVWGRRFSPNSPLSQFPPDSGFVRIAVELGWIGLIIYASLIFIIMRTGIKNYFNVKNSEIKVYIAALLTVVFSLIIANYTQQAITMFPTMTLFYLIMALLVVLNKFDKPQ